MPYGIRKSGDKWITYKKDGGMKVGTHDSREKAMAQMRLLYMKEKEK